MVREESGSWFFVKTWTNFITNPCNIQTKTIQSMLQFLFEIKFIEKKNRLLERSLFCRQQHCWLIHYWLQIVIWLQSFFFFHSQDTSHGILMHLMYMCIHFCIKISNMLLRPVGLSVYFTCVYLYEKHFSY